MATIAGDTLKARYAALQAEREQSWTAAQLEGNIHQRQLLSQRFDPAAVAQPGVVLPPLSFANVEGGTVSLGEITAPGHALIAFFRYAGCPADNIALPYYARALAPGLTERGIGFLALSPQPAHLLKAIKERHALPFAIATDTDNHLARLLGIAFQPDERPSPPPAGWIGETAGTNSWELPQPSFLLLDSGRIVRWLHVSPDWLDRPEADAILGRIDLEIGETRL
ncbi:peroxiredoxin-like family protein [Sphingobium bisphenolivorans]|uniref:peroxiredoxin-like family protein n=1 Tax=Sphingobium bisphenolivorans TaxID=1335760 RepID=UPI0003A0093C|nr:peroxiredoxin-like family protein [Sphingobium bisphenolivorans]